MLTSEAYLITSKHSKHPELVELIRKRIIGYLTACRLMDENTCSCGDADDDDDDDDVFLFIVILCLI